MNKIEAKCCKIPEIIKPVLCVYIDGVRLDEIVSKFSEDSVFSGYMPSWSNEVSSLDDVSLIWSVSTRHGPCEILPILLCPEERDLSYRPVVTEISIEDDKVNWNKLGEMTEYVSTSKTEWFSDVAYVFSLKDYRCMLKAFRNEINEGDDLKLKAVVNSCSAPL